MGLPTEYQLAAVVLVVLVACFVHAALTVLGHSLSTQVRKHDIIVGARQRRLEYMTAVAERAAAVSGGPGQPTQEEPQGFNVDIVEDDEEIDAQPMRRAA